MTTKYSVAREAGVFVWYCCLLTLLWLVMITVQVVTGHHAASFSPWIIPVAGWSTFAYRRGWRDAQQPPFEWYIGVLDDERHL